MGKRTYRLDANGRPMGLPFPYNFSITDWGNDSEAMVNHLDGMVDEFEQIQSGIRPGQPHPMWYVAREANPQYQVDLDIFKRTSSTAAAREIDRMIHPPPPRPLSREEKILLYGSEEDRAALKEASELYKLVDAETAEGNRLVAMGDPDRAKEHLNRAAWFARPLERLMKQPSSIDQREKEKTLDFVKGRLEEMKSWPREKIKKNETEVAAMTKSWRDLSDDKTIFLVDYGSPIGGRDDEGSGRLVKITTPHPANQVSAVVNEDTNQGLFNAAIRGGWDTERPAETPPEPSYSNQFEGSLKPLEQP
jgi:hypothetical protein